MATSDACARCGAVGRRAVRLGDVVTLADHAPAVCTRVAVAATPHRRGRSVGDAATVECVCEVCATQVAVVACGDVVATITAGRWREIVLEVRRGE